MKFIVTDALGHVVYDGGSWPMARAALDYVVQKVDGCPRLDIRPDSTV